MASGTTVISVETYKEDELHYGDLKTQQKDGSTVSFPSTDWERKEAELTTIKLTLISIDFPQAF